MTEANSSRAMNIFVLYSNTRVVEVIKELNTSEWSIHGVKKTN